MYPVAVDHGCPVSLCLLQHRHQISRVVLEVSILHDDVVATCMWDAGPKSGTFSQVVRILEGSEGRSGYCLDDVPGPIRRAVVDDQDLEVQR